MTLVWEFLAAKFAADPRYWTSAGMLIQDLPINLEMPLLKAALQALVQQGKLSCEPNEDGDIYRRAEPTLEQMAAVLQKRSEGEMRLDWLKLAEAETLDRPDGAPMFDGRIHPVIRTTWPTLGREARMVVLLQLGY